MRSAHGHGRSGTGHAAGKGGALFQGRLRNERHVVHFMDRPGADEYGVIRSRTGLHLRPPASSHCCHGFASSAGRLVEPSFQEAGGSKSGEGRACSKTQLDVAAKKPSVRTTVL